MRRKLLGVAAAVLCVGVAGACVRNVPGTVAMTTEPGPTTTRPTKTPRAFPSLPSLPSLPILPFPSTSPTSPTSVVPAPANALTMTCKEFIGLDDATRKAVVQAILDQQKDSPFGVLGAEFAESMATTMCQFLPQSTVREVLAATPPR